MLSPIIHSLALVTTASTVSIPLTPLVVRWLHILCACLAIGVPLFVRYVLRPAAAATLDHDSCNRLYAAINRFWRIIVHLLITLFILTGLYTFIFTVLPTPLGEYRPIYHALFGMKMLLALVAFFIASVLPGRSSAFAFIRAKSRLWLTILIFLLLLILMLADALRATRDLALAARLSPPTTAPATAPLPMS